MRRTLLTLAQALASWNTTGIYGTALYGGINDYAYYFVDVLVGTPPSRQSVILDSGSSLLGFPCTSCGKKCGKHMDPPFDISSSLTAETYSCSDSKCVSRNDCSRDKQCLYTQVYSEGSSIEGFFFSDELSFAGMNGETNPLVRYDYIGCHNRETVLFTSQQASGILGVSFPRGGKQPTVMDAFMTAPGIAERRFALCAAEDGGVLLIGGYDASLNAPSLAKSGALGTTNRWLRGWAFKTPEPVENPSTDLVWTRMINNYVYSIKVSGLSTIDPFTKKFSRLVDRGFGDVLVDSGTTYTYLPNEIYQRVSKFLIDTCNKNNGLPDNQRAGQCVRSKQDLICYDFASTNIELSELMARIPSFSLELSDGGSIEWKPEAYLFRKGTNVWCAAIENNRRSHTILGMSFLKMKQVVFDRANSAIGFVSASCPSVTERQTPMNGI